jgi:hypothetical protein
MAVDPWLMPSQSSNPLQSLFDVNKDLIKFFYDNSHDLGLAILAYGFVINSWRLVKYALDSNNEEEGPGELMPNGEFVKKVNLNEQILRGVIFYLSFESVW